MPDTLRNLSQNFGKDRLAGDRLKAKGGLLPSVDRVRGILDHRENAYTANFYVDQPERRVSLNLSFYKPDTNCCPLQQLVISSGTSGPGVTHIGAMGEYRIVFGGTNGGGGITVQTPPVIQDTAGFTGFIGEMIPWATTGSITSWSIPDRAAAGRYAVSWETFTYNTPWWVTTSAPAPGDSNPQNNVPYYHGGGGAHFGAELSSKGATCRWQFRVNGSMVLETVATAPLAPGGIIDTGLVYFTGQSASPPREVTLGVGDVCEFWLVFDTGTHFFNTSSTHYGENVYGAQQGVLVMTKLRNRQHASDLP